MSYVEQYLTEAGEILRSLDRAAIERMAILVAEARAREGRLFILGVGGSAANASHAVNDFRKIVGIEAYTPTDNVAELTAQPTTRDGNRRLQPGSRPVACGRRT